MATHHTDQTTVGGDPSEDHSHDYRHASRRSLLIVLALLACQMTVEVVGSIMSGSLGLLAHATHMITDVVAILVALFAMWISQRPATITRTFGYQRIEVLVVMLNAIALLGLASWLFTSALNRFNEHAQGEHHHVDGMILLIIASIGLVINIFSAWTLYRTSRHSINVEGAFWHVMADLMGSIGVFISGVVLLVFDWDLIDPILTMVIAALVVASAARLAVKVFRIIVEGVPAGLDMYHLCSEIEDVEGVTLVHDVHAWTITTGYNALAAHVLVDPGYQRDLGDLTRDLRHLIRDKFGIHHVTLQVEQSVSDCDEDHHLGHLEARKMSEVR